MRRHPCQLQFPLAGTGHFVGRHGPHLREPCFDFEERPVHIRDRDAEDLLNEGNAAPAIGYREENSFP